MMKTNNYRIKRMKLKYKIKHCQVDFKQQKYVIYMVSLNTDSTYFPIRLVE